MPGDVNVPTPCPAITRDSVIALPGDEATSTNVTLLCAEGDFITASCPYLYRPTNSTDVMIALSFGPMIIWPFTSSLPCKMMSQPQAPSNKNAATHLIVIMGVSGSGKSSLAEMLAEYYGYHFVDADDFHNEEARTRMAEGLPLSDKMRAPWVASICRYLQSRAKNQQHCILAFSGLKRIHRDQLREAGLCTFFIFLCGDRSTLQDRLNKRTGHFMAPVLLDSQLNSLEQPLAENDVYPLDISSPISTILHKAITVIDQQYGMPKLVTK